jgi:hypothetical protein
MSCGLADERQGDEVDALLDADEGVGAILGGEGGEVHLHAGEVDVAARGEGAGGEHAAADVGVILREHLEADEAVVHQHGVADLDVVDEVLVVHVDGADLLDVLAARRRA